MEGNFKPSSFIPEEPLDSAPTKRARKRSSLSGFMILAWIIFALSLLGAGGAYVYEQFSKSQVEEKQEELRERQAHLQNDVVEDLSRLSSRLQIGETLLDSHVIVTPIFAYLEGSTLRSVQFSNLTLERADGGFAVTLSGETDSYASVALQADALASEPIFLNPILSNFGVSEAGAVAFDVAFSVAPQATRYKTYIE